MAWTKSESEGYGQLAQALEFAKRAQAEREEKRIAAIAAKHGRDIDAVRAEEKKKSQPAFSVERPPVDLVVAILTRCEKVLNFKKQQHRQWIARQVKDGCIEEGERAAELAFEAPSWVTLAELGPELREDWRVKALMPKYGSFFDGEWSLGQSAFGRLVMKAVS